jgi:cytochrome c-type biogenesis protein CcmH/NrfG
MDRLDSVSIGLLILLSLCLVAVIRNGGMESAPVVEGMSMKILPSVRDEMDRRAREIREAIAGDALQRAQELITRALRDFPQDGRFYMFQGDVFLRRQDILGAIQWYARAVRIEPDFVDRNTPLFQGRKIRVVLDEVLKGMEKGEVHPPAGIKKEIYYLIRKLAGSCG